MAADGPICNRRLSEITRPHGTIYLRRLQREGIAVGRTTLRRILVNAGLKSPQRRRPPKHRVRRQRMPRQGMLIQMDGSHHPWLGDQVPPFTLLIAVDDATGTVAHALFCEKEESYTYFLLIQDLLQSVGIPIALYVDRHGVFRHTPGSGLPGTSTQFSRAMDELGIQMIFALSPQAKGRVERAAGTFQDRLVTELRLAGASSIREANGVLEQFLPRYNRRFQVPPQCSESAYRPLGPDLSLEQVLCFKHRRKVAKDNTVKFQLHTLQLLPEPERPSYAGAVVEVLEGLDGRLRVRHEERIINAQEAPPSPAFLRNGHGDSATPPASPAGAKHSDQRWATTLKSLDSRAADEEDQAGITGGASAALTPATVLPAQTNLPAEGEMEGDSESHAQGDVAAGDREGVGDPQSHHQEIHGCRRSSGAAVPACSHCVNIRYSGAITK